MVVGDYAFNESVYRITAETAVFDTEYYMDYALTAAEYVGGYILAVDANNALCFIKPGYWDERTQIAELGVKIRELAFDPKTKTLYGYNSSDLTLCSIDITTGEVTNISAMYGLSTVIAMTCDSEEDCIYWSAYNYSYMGVSGSLLIFYA